MKQFRKTKDDLFICEECGKTFKTHTWLSRHVKNKHNLKIYYDKWLKEELEGNCIICGENTKFISFYGYKNTCSDKCILELRKKSCLEKFGVDNVFKCNNIKEKIKNTNLLKYGHENYLNSKEGIKKKKETWIKNYGVDNPRKSSVIDKKIKETNLIKYGVEYTHQNREILEKSFKTRRCLKQYLNTNISYQGSYELDFLEKYYDKIDIENGPSINYLFEGKNKVYHSDFYIPSLNLVVEIKSTYILTLDREIIEKKKATISNGFNYILILDKNYNDFIISSVDNP